MPQIRASGNYTKRISLTVYGISGILMPQRSQMATMLTQTY